MRFTPLNEQQAAAQSSGLWDNGLYDYEVSEAEEKISRNGNEMIHLKVWIFNSAGNRKLLDSYLVSSEKAAWRIREFAKSCGLLEAYESGSLMEGEIVGRTGQCEVGTEQSEGYPPKNTIRSWLAKQNGASRQATSRPVDRRTKHPAGAELNDDIPF